MTTARSIIESSLKQLRVYAPGDTVADADLAEGLTQFNRLLDFLSNDSAACFAITEQSNALTANDGHYTIGSSGDFNMTRPLRLIYGPGAAYVLDSNNVRYNLDVWPQDKWTQIGYTAQTADVPSVLFYDPQYPLGEMNFWPIPTLAYTAYWTSYLQLGQLSTYATSLSFPPGYEAMLQNNLTVWLKPFYKTAMLDPDIERLAARTLSAVKRVNRRQNVAEYDPELLSRGQGTFNIYTGE